jgi:hypothetical protein
MGGRYSPNRVSGIGLLTAALAAAGFSDGLRPELGEDRRQGMDAGENGYRVLPGDVGKLAGEDDGLVVG